MIRTLVLLYTSIFAVAHASYHLKDNSLIAPYQSPLWSTYGSAVAETQFVRLTSDTQSLTGGVYNLKPIESRDWEVSLLFHVHGHGKTLFGDGFAFWYTQHPPSPGPAFGSRDAFRGLGIFFDTYANQNGEHSHEHPYVSAMINDGTKRYDHDKDGTITELKGCSSNFRNSDYALAIIRYAGNQLSVKLKYEGTETPVECFTVDGVHLPTGYYIGASAATGELSDNHDIYSIHTYQLDVSRPHDDPRVDYAKIEPSADDASPMRERVEDVVPSRGSRIFWALFCWSILLSFISGIGYFGYRYYRQRQRQSKRFY